MNLMTGNTTRLTEACKYGSIYLRPHGQAVKTSPFHGGNTSSNLVGVIIWRHSQAVRRGSATPWSPVQIWLSPLLWEPQNPLFIRVLGFLFYNFDVCACLRKQKLFLRWHVCGSEALRIIPAGLFKLHCEAIKIKWNKCSIREEGHETCYLHYMKSL